MKTITMGYIGTTLTSQRPMGHCKGLAEHMDGSNNNDNARNTNHNTTNCSSKMATKIVVTIMTIVTIITIVAVMTTVVCIRTSRSVASEASRRCSGPQAWMTKVSTSRTFLSQASAQDMSHNLNSLKGVI